MILFNSDLDNTLIYSYKHDIGPAKKCVEIYQGREISFMSMASYDMLKIVNEKLCFVPTTTRTPEQYKRVHLGIDEPKYALVSNGGILLTDGLIDNVWYKESLRLISDCHPELLYAEELLQEDENRCLEPRNINGLFIFTKSNKPLKTVEWLQQSLDNQKVDIFCNGIKVYVIPKQLNKGNAVKRLRARLGADYIIAAGDSEFDISMAQEADEILLPKVLAANLLVQKNMVLFEGPELFTDYIMKHIIKIIEE